MKTRLIIAGASVLMLVALPALAGPADPAPDLRAAIFAAPAAECALPEVRETAGLPGPPIPPADCTAHCQDGSTRTCTGTSCDATDWSCPSQSGHCWSNWEGYKYCPAPTCPCYASTTCLSGPPVSCQGTSNDCFSVYQCYAHCDGQYYLCQSTPPSCPP